MVYVVLTNENDDHFTLMNTRGNRLVFEDEEHAIYFLEVEIADRIEKSVYTDYELKPYPSGESELGYKWNEYIF